MKVSPEYLIQLSHRVNTLHREKEKFIESPGEKDRKVIESPSEKRNSKHNNWCQFESVGDDRS